MSQRDQWNQRPHTVVRNTYDAVGNVMNFHRRRGIMTKYKYDDLSEVTQVIAGIDTTALGYKAASSPAGLTSTAYEYSHGNRVAIS